MIGLDCAAPELVFDRWRDLLPNLRKLMERGLYGPLESTIPPITVPAWVCMATGKDPGELGIYGFRNRLDHSYDRMALASSRLVREPALWDRLGERGLRTIALGVPLTYPPRPIQGLMVSGFPLSETAADIVYPPELKAEIDAVVGRYIPDIADFRNADRAQLLADLYTMTERRFQLARHLITKHPWDLFFMVEMGTDRIHHAFWRYFDPEHPLYEPNNPFLHAIRDYYIAVDAEIGRLVELLEPETRLIVVSDHGAKRMVGGLCFNEWLIQEGYLTLKQPPQGVVKFSPDLVDWSRTRAWGDGGYYGRLFLNVRGREPEGVVDPAEADALKTELIARLEDLRDEAGRPLNTKVFRSEQVYRQRRGVAPDLIVYFGDLHWRSVGSVGHGTIWTHTNDTGPDDANHAQQGIFLMADVADLRRSDGAGGEAALQANRREGLSLYDVSPTVLDLLGLPAPEGTGRSVIGRINSASPASAYTEEEEEEIARRLEDLGYL